MKIIKCHFCCIKEEKKRAKNKGWMKLKKYKYWICKECYYAYATVDKG